MKRQETGGSGIVEKGSNHGSVGIQDGFFLLTSVGASKGIDNVDTGWSSGYDRVNVGREYEMGVESNSQYAVSAFLR